MTAQAIPVRTSYSQTKPRWSAKSRRWICPKCAENGQHHLFLRDVDAITIKCKRCGSAFYRPPTPKAD